MADEQSENFNTDGEKLQNATPKIQGNFKIQASTGGFLLKFGIWNFPEF
jgi:hypothetical protein